MNATPRRIQLRRTAGWRKPADAIVVARPSRWGNPVRVGEPLQLTTAAGDVAIITTTPTVAVEFYRDVMRTRLTPVPGEHPDDAAWVEQWRTWVARLRGHDLACWCPLDQACHADVLLELANGRLP
ncbi:DUF4326 domain-containing protein [Microcystis phage MinS1]|nr:DUF4326 domain-containing protein [Microcystis phage MinS1]